MTIFLRRFLKYFLCFLATAAVLAVGLIVYLLWFQPPLYFPKPTGPYAVGTKEYYWVDAKRKEIYSEDLAHPHRELMATIWYPTSLKLRRASPAQEKLSEKPTTPYAPYLVNYFKKNQNFFLNLKDEAFRPIYSYAQPDLPIATDNAQFPVIIFSHGFGCVRNDNTAQCEELASHGYIVVGISHTYDTCVVQFPGNRIAEMVSMEKRTKGKNFIEHQKQLDQEIEIWISDARFVLDQLEELANDKESIFYQRFDQKNIGIFGHSFGGATAIQICRRDPRVKAGVDLDGSLYGFNATKTFDKPCMVMLAGNTVKREEQPMAPDDWKKFEIHSLNEEKIFKSRYLPAFKQLQSIGHDVYVFVVKNAEHMDFCDVAIFKNTSLYSWFLIKLGIAKNSTTIDGFLMTKIVNAYLVNFFDKYLKNTPSELLDGGKKVYPEVKRI